MNCPKCRMPVQPGVMFCANCGTDVRGAAPQPGPAGWGAPPPGQPGYPPPGYSPPAAPPGPPGYGPQPMPVAPPAASGGSTGLKVLGGCGVAGCLGAAIAAVAVFGLIFALILLTGSSSSSSSGGPVGRGGALPGSGSLRDLVRPSVGGFTLMNTAPVTKLGDRLSPGVVDSLGAFYRAPDGTQLVQILLAYPSPSIAEERMGAVLEVATQVLEPGQKITRTQLKNSSGDVIGSSLSITGGSVEHVYWSNGKLLTFCSAPAPNAVNYFDASPY